MELDGEAVEVTDVKGTKVMMESVVEESIVNGEIAWWILVR